MAAVTVKQLQSRDPVVRKKAIKAAAKALDRNALKRLAIMCEDDPDPEIRDLARRAGVYIRQQLGELSSAAPAEDGEGQTASAEAKKDAHPPKIAVSDDDVERSKKTMDMAVTQHMAGEKAKAMKFLKQAVLINPNLQHDGYFVNLAQTITGIEDKAQAIAQLGDKAAQAQFIETEQKAKRQQKLDAHLAEVGKSGKQDVVFDAALLFMAVMIGTIMMGFLAVQFAQGYLKKIDDNILAVDEARANGRVQIDPATGEEIFLSTELGATGKPKPFTEFIPDAGLYQMAQNLSKAEFGSVLLLGLGAGILGLISALAASGVMHGLSSALGGQGNWAYFTHHWLGLLLIRTIVVAVVLTVGLLLIFEGNGGAIVMIVGVIVGLIVLLTVMKAFGMVGRAYNTSFAKGMIAGLSGVVVMALAAGLPAMILF